MRNRKDIIVLLTLSHSIDVGKETYESFTALNSLIYLLCTIHGMNIQNIVYWPGMEHMWSRRQKLSLVLVDLPYSVCWLPENDHAAHNTFGVRHNMSIEPLGKDAINSGEYERTSIRYMTCLGWVT